jgi:hypothetical protein
MKNLIVVSLVAALPLALAAGTAGCDAHPPHVPPHNMSEPVTPKNADPAVAASGAPAASAAPAAVDAGH